MTMLKVYNAGEKPDTITYLQLVPSGAGIMLRAVGPTGRIQGPGNLIKIFPDGTFQRQSCSELVPGKSFKDRDGSRYA